MPAGHSQASARAHLLARPCPPWPSAACRVSTEREQRWLPQCQPQVKKKHFSGSGRASSPLASLLRAAPPRIDRVAPRMDHVDESRKDEDRAFILRLPAHLARDVHQMLADNNFQDLRINIDPAVDRCVLHRVGSALAVPCQQRSTRGLPGAGARLTRKCCRGCRCAGWGRAASGGARAPSA